MQEVQLGKPYLSQRCNFPQNLDKEIGVPVLQDDLLDRVLSVIQAIPDLED